MEIRLRQRWCFSVVATPSEVGAIELWHTDPERSFRLTLKDGYYCTADMFEFNSKHTNFLRGYGLPGRVWKHNMPFIVKDVLDSKAFLRGKAATEIGINGGIGIPYVDPSGHVWVVTMLSGRDTPIAGRMEIWVLDEHRRALIFHSGNGDARNASARIGPGEGTFGRAWQARIPVLCKDLSDDHSAAGQSAFRAGLTTLVALPVIAVNSVTAVVGWYN
jgi:GAF domain